MTQSSENEAENAGEKLTQPLYIQRLACPENSKILEHSLNSGSPVVEKDFKILDCCDNFDIRTLESLYIHKLKPSLNDQHSSTDLFIVH